MMRWVVLVVLIMVVYVGIARVLTKGSTYPEGSGAGLRKVILSTPFSLPVVAADRSSEVFKFPAGIIAGPILINFWASWCDACLSEFPLLDSLWAGELRKKKNIVMLGISVDDDQADVRKTERLSDGLFPVLLDASSRFAHALNVRGIPTTLLFDRYGAVVWEHEGEMNEAHLRSLEQLVEKL